MLAQTAVQAFVQRCRHPRRQGLISALLHISSASCANDQMCGAQVLCKGQLKLVTLRCGRRWAAGNVQDMEPFAGRCVSQLFRFSLCFAAGTAHAAALAADHVRQPEFVRASCQAARRETFRLQMSKMLQA